MKVLKKSAHSDQTSKSIIGTTSSKRHLRQSQQINSKAAAVNYICCANTSFIHWLIFMTKNILAFFVVLVFDDGLCHLFVHGPGVVDLLNHDPGDLLVVATDLRTLLTLRAATKARATFR